MAFTVTEIKDASTIEVSPRWSWQGRVGSLVRISGFNSVSPQNTEFILTKLRTLILNKEVDLKNAINNIISVGDNNSQITASVYLNNVDISIYFPELKTPA